MQITCSFPTVTPADRRSHGKPLSATVECLSWFPVHRTAQMTLRVSSNYTLNERQLGSEPLLVPSLDHPPRIIESGTEAVFVSLSSRDRALFIPRSFSHIQCFPEPHWQVNGPCAQRRPQLYILQLGKFSRMLWYRIED